MSKPSDDRNVWPSQYVVTTTMEGQPMGCCCKKTKTDLDLAREALAKAVDLTTKGTDPSTVNTLVHVAEGYRRLHEASQTFPL